MFLIPTILSYFGKIVATINCNYNSWYCKLLKVLSWDNKWYGDRHENFGEINCFDAQLKLDGYIEEQLSWVATVVFNERLLHAFSFLKKLPWFEPTKVISLKTQLHAVNACVKRSSQRSFSWCCFIQQNVKHFRKTELSITCEIRVCARVCYWVRKSVNEREGRETDWEKARERMCVSLSEGGGGEVMPEKQWSCKRDKCKASEREKDTLVGCLLEWITDHLLCCCGCCCCCCWDVCRCY